MAKFQVSTVAFTLLASLALLLWVAPSAGQSDVFIPGTGVAKTCGFNLLVRLVTSNTCKGCSKTNSAAQTWSFELLYVGEYCGCGPICSTAGFHLFSLCQDSIHGAGFNWGRRRRRRDVAVVNAGINNIRSNSSIPNKVTAEELLKELQEAEKRLKEMGLIKNYATANQSLTSVHTESVVNSNGTQSGSRLRRDAKSCVIDWDDIPMNKECCLTAGGCSALQLREFC